MFLLGFRRQLVFPLCVAGKFGVSLGFRGIGLAIIFRAVHRDLKRFSLPVRFFSWELGGGTRFCILLGFWLLAKAILGLRRPPVSDTGTPVSDTDTPVSDMERLVSVTMVPFPKRR